MAGRKLRRGRIDSRQRRIPVRRFSPDKSSRDLMADAYSEAVGSVDKGFDPGDIEALYVGNFTADLFEGQSHLGHVIADHLGLAPRPATRVEGACASSSLAFRQGVMAIASGLHDVVMVGGVEKMTDASAAEVQSHLAVAGDVAMEVDQAGFTFPAFYAAMASAYMARYGATPEHFMHVAIKNHENGALNPKAQFNESLQDTMGRRVKRAAERGEPAPAWRDEIDFLSDDKANPMVASPLRLFDCSPVTDGASCMLLVADEIADSFTDRPVAVAASSQASAGPFGAWGGDITSLPAAKEAAKNAYDMAGVSPDDIDVAEVHDCFTPAEVLAIEDVGFFPAGQGAFAAAEGPDGRVTPTGPSTSRAGSKPRATPSARPASPRCTRSGRSFGAAQATVRSRTRTCGSA